MRKIFCVVTLLLVGFICPAFSVFAQNFYAQDWRVYTAMTDVRAMVHTAQNDIWAATSGGVFQFQHTDSLYREFRTLGDSSIMSTDVSAIFVNSDNTVFVGTSDGFLDILPPASRTWTHITDIRAKQGEFPSVRINDFLPRTSNTIDSLIFIATDFGITIFNVSSLRFAETITNFNGVNFPSVKKLLISGNTLFAVTSSGLFRTTLDRTFWNNPRNPANWRQVPFSQSPSSLQLTSIIESTFGIYVGGNTACWKLSADSLQLLFQTPSPVISFTSTSKGVVLYATESEVRESQTGNIIFTRSNQREQIRQCVLKNDQEILIATSLRGILSVPIENSTSYQQIMPNTPQSNQFYRRLLFDAKGNLVISTDRDGRGNGLFVLKNDESWVNINSTTFPALSTNDLTDIVLASDGNIWASSWGSGAFRFRDSADSYSLSRFNQTNSTFRGIASDSAFVVPSQLTVDRKGIVWATNFLSPVITYFDKNSSFGSVLSPYGSLDCLFALTDINDTKWFASSPEKGSSPVGLVWFNDKNTPSNTADDRWGVVSPSNSLLPSNTINGFELDKNGAIWIATASGLFVIDNPQAVLTGTRLFLRQVSIISSQNISCVSVDALNQKWVGTNNGVIIINSDGSEVIGKITTENSPISSNLIKALAVNPKTGVAYIGLSNALYAVQTLSIEPNNSFSSLRCFPLPFSPTIDKELVVEGLAEQTLVKILTIDGRLIKDIPANNSRRIVWDGRDEKGNLVPNGVYLVSGYSASSSETSVAKILIKE